LIQLSARRSGWAGADAEHYCDFGPLLPAVDAPYPSMLHTVFRRWVCQHSLVRESLTQQYGAACAVGIVLMLWCRYRPWAGLPSQSGQK